MNTLSEAPARPEIRVVLCDRNEAVVSAWREQFDECPEVVCQQGDILEADAQALALPGNAFGFLDRGLGLQVCERFSWELQNTLRETIRTRFHGELLVGQATFTPLEGSFDHLLYTCIYRTPQSTGETINAFLAARGVFLALGDPEAPEVKSIALPGFGTGSGGLHPLISARQVRYAYEIFSGRRGLGDKNLSQLARRERKLRSFPRSHLESRRNVEPGES